LSLAQIIGMCFDGWSSPSFRARELVLRRWGRVAPMTRPGVGLRQSAAVPMFSQKDLLPAVS